MRICTIIARNYLGQAEVLAESFREHHPNGEVTILVVDDVAQAIESRAGLYEVIRPEDLPIPRFEGMAAMYDVTELCTAVKPWLLRHLLDAGSPVAYFDPDICFYDGIGDLEQLARVHQIVLTPHMTSPFPDDGQRPNDQRVLVAGAYNLGFIALGPGEASSELLDWWSARLRFDCISDVDNDLFVDQRWFDLVPGMFPTTLLVRDPGLNVAYWNLHEREVRIGDGGRPFVGDAPLKFFHFSGFDPWDPGSLSRHQTRVRLRETPVLAGLCREYARRVVAHGSPVGQRPWPFEKLADGRRLDLVLRRLYREGEREGAFAHSPFTSEGTEEFIDWLTEVPPDAPGYGINRFWAYIYRLRSDLQDAFPALAGADGEHYLDWIVRHGVVEVESRGLLPAAVDGRGDDPPVGVPAVRPSGRIAAEDGPVWGVNVAGYLESELGIGEAARATISGLDAAKIPVLPIHGRWRPASRQDHHYATFDPRDAVFPVNLLCVNADLTERWLEEAGPAFRAGRHTIGFWWWEVTAWPERWQGAFDLVDEVWVATEHIRAALAPVATVPVVKVTLPIQTPAPRLQPRAELGLPEGFLFFFMFDYCSVAERKNPFDTIEAFIAAFAPGEGAKLAVKCINQDADPVAHARLRRVAARHPDVHLIEGYVSAADKNSMLASADCYVSLHRSEGYGLSLAESLLLEKPVIATRYSGNLDFMDAEGSWLVDAKIVPIGPHNDPYPADGEWAQPDVEQASRFMREVFADPAGARRRAARGAERLRRTHSPRAGGATMAARLELLRHRHTSRLARQAASAAPTAPARLDDAAALLDRGPEPYGPLAGRPRRTARRSALRAMKPYTAFQQEVDRSVLDAMRALQQETEAARVDAAERSGAQFAKQAGVVAAAVRKLEFSIAELSAQLGGQADASAAWHHGLGESLQGLERHVTALEADLATRLDDLSERMVQAEAQLQQLGREGSGAVRPAPDPGPELRLVDGPRPGEAAP